MEEGEEADESTDQAVIEEVLEDSEAAEDSEDETMPSSPEQRPRVPGRFGPHQHRILLGEDDGETDDDDEDDEDDREIPLQPRIMLGGLYAVLGQAARADSSGEEEGGEEGAEEGGERFDSELPGQHTYLGHGTEVRNTQALSLCRCSFTRSSSRLFSQCNE